MKDNKRLKRRVRNSYIVSTVSMALVLFLLGSVGYLMTAALRVARTLQESVTVTVELADGVDSLRRGEIERRLRGDEMVRDIEFVSKQTKIGDAEFRHMFENEIEEVLGENPLNDSFEVHLSAESADSVRLDAFMAKAGGMRGVERAERPAADDPADARHGGQDPAGAGGLRCGVAGHFADSAEQYDPAFDLLEALPHQYDEAGRRDQVVRPCGPFWPAASGRGWRQGPALRHCSA